MTKIISVKDFRNLMFHCSNLYFMKFDHFGGYSRLVACDYVHKHPVYSTLCLPSDEAERIYSEIFNSIL